MSVEKFFVEAVPRLRSEMIVPIDEETEEST